jgi:hypothetical protein
VRVRAGVRAGACARAGGRGRREVRAGFFLGPARQKYFWTFLKHNSSNDRTLGKMSDTFWAGFSGDFAGSFAGNSQKNLLRNCPAIRRRSGGKLWTISARISGDNLAGIADDFRQQFRQKNWTRSGVFSER